MSKRVAVLCATKTSVYKQLDGVDVYDRERDILTWPGGQPVVAHPPCGQWGRLRRFAHRDLHDKALAPLCIMLARWYGGVVEHPAFSTLWQYMGLPKPGHWDAHGRTIGVSQFWFGHRAEKKTWLYIVGADVPSLPFAMGDAPAVVEHDTNCRHDRPVIPDWQRAATPLRFAEWLVSIARRSIVPCPSL